MKDIWKEYEHSYSNFVSIVPVSKLDVSSLNEKEIQITHYKTKYPLPRYIIFSDVIEEKTESLSILEYIESEEKRILAISKKLVKEFEDLKPNNEKNNFKFDLNRFYLFINSLLLENDSHAFLLLTVSKKFGDEQISNNISLFKKIIGTLIKTYSTAISIFNDKTHKNNLEKIIQKIKELKFSETYIKKELENQVEPE